MNELACWLRLQLTPGLGRAGLFRLIEQFGSPQDAIAAADYWRTLPGIRQGAAALLPAEDDPRLSELLEPLATLDVWLLSCGDADYPPLLRNIPDPPALLYGRGVRRFGEALAIVGSRAPSLTGKIAAETLAREMAAQGMTVVSGLARGIDAAAHRGALAAGGHTIAVLGCGIDRVYPQENRRLFTQIAENGTLLSEYLPGSDPLPGHFPGRNRIISGLSRGTLVIEAAIDSGSLITAELALEQGREVFAVPGSIDRPTSAGPNRLIKDGAHPVTEPADVLSVLWPERSCRTPMAEQERFAATLDGPARSVWAALSQQPRHVDELSGELGLTAGELSAILLHLELQGGIEQLPGARYIRAGHLPASP
ncbi:MAG: DNA-processing protein DprA [Desulfuromonadales bacterium]|nr:DNA-processing protein DprA [Desulfuromonadales bacterium]